MKNAGHFIVENETDYLKGYRNGWGNGVFAGFAFAVFVLWIIFALVGH